jgi:hypothetical protein
MPAKPISSAPGTTVSPSSALLAPVQTNVGRMEAMTLNLWVLQQPDTSELRLGPRPQVTFQECVAPGARPILTVLFVLVSK